MFDVWKIHSKEKGITRFKERSSDTGSRIDRIMISSGARKVVKRSHMRVGERVSDHAPVIWDFSLVADNDWRPIVAYNNSQLNWEKWNEKTTDTWKEWLKGQACISSSLLSLSPSERCCQFEQTLKKCHQKVYQLIGVGNNIIRLSKKKKQAKASGDTQAANAAQNKIKKDTNARINASQTALV